MIKHVVCFKLKDCTKEKAEYARDLLLTMKGRVPEVLELFAGVDFLHSERSYDLILEVTVADRAALERYQQDPYHCNTIKTHMHAVRESSVAVDVELPNEHAENL